VEPEPEPLSDPEPEPLTDPVPEPEPFNDPEPEAWPCPPQAAKQAENAIAAMLTRTEHLSMVALLAKWGTPPSSDIK
jgi:hypothetical protein